MLANCFKSIRRHGLVITAASYWNRLRERIYERKLGIRSGDIISLEELGLEHEERREHYPTQLNDFRRMKRFLQPATENEVFVDYGVGLGRVLILAAMLPFKSVIGIEISAVLAERARENVSKCRGKLRCKDIEIVNADAAAFDVPIDVTTIFFNNPFAGKILANVLKKIYVSYEQRPRPIRLICNLPSESAFREQICQAQGIELQHQVDLGEGRQCFVFSVKGSNDEAVSHDVCNHGLGVQR
jgi:predicted RNA methylase